MIAGILNQLHDLSISATVRESLWLFPVLECIHIYSMIFLISTLSAFDLRLIGMRVSRRPPKPLSQLSRVVSKWAAGCVGINFVTGVLLFLSKAPDYYINSAFRIKMILVVLAVGYHAVLLPSAFRWNEGTIVLLRTKVAAVVALALWVSVIAASRWIAFVQS